MQRPVSDNDISALYNPYNGVLLFCLKIGLNYVVEQWDPLMWKSLGPLWLLLYRLVSLICKNSCVSPCTACSWNSIYTVFYMEGVMYSGS